MVDFVDKLIYNQIATDVKHTLCQIFPQGQFLIPEQLQCSQSNLYNHLVIIFCHVDPIDLVNLIESAMFQEQYPDLFVGEFKLIVVHSLPQNLFMTYCYYSYYSGFLLNRLIKPFDLEITHTGFYQKGNNNLLTNSWLKILECLSYSFNTWNRGFTYPEELFTFFQKSNFFFPDLHQYEPTNLSWSSSFEEQLWQQFKTWLLHTSTGELLSIPPQNIKERLYTRITDTLPHVQL